MNVPPQLVLPMTQQVLPAYAFVARLALGAGLGFLIGLERQRRQSAAGVHTTSLVAVGATLFAMIEPLLGDKGASSRVIANIVTGVGFLAGGVILKEGTNIRGLNTAATIWSTAAVGALAGMGLYMEAALGAAVIVALNTIMEPVIRTMARFARPTRDTAMLYSLTADVAVEAVPAVRGVVLQAVSNSALTLRSMSTKSAQSGGISVAIELAQPTRDDAPVEALRERLAGSPGVSGTAWTSTEL